MASRKDSAAATLTPYNGRDVLRASVIIRNAGDGLSKALSVDPVELDIDQRVTVVLDCDVDAHDHKRIKGTDCLELVLVLKAGTATVIDRDLVKQYLDEQELRIEKASGVERLPLGGEQKNDGDDDAED